MMTTEELIDYHIDAAKLTLMHQGDMDPMMLVEDADDKVSLVQMNGRGLHPYQMLMMIAEKVRTEMHPVRVSMSVDSYITRISEDGVSDRSEAVQVIVVSVETTAVGGVAYERRPAGLVFEEPMPISNETDGRMIEAMRSLLVTHRDPD